MGCDRGEEELEPRERGGTLRKSVNYGNAGKKCGAENGDPNLRFQPRLPGSVVGEASMEQREEVYKITRVTDPW